MSKNTLLSTSIALATLVPTLALATPAHAGVTRSGSSLPNKSQSVKYAENRGRSASDLPDHVGPKKGWPDNHGIDNAWEHANEHSAHHRNDSEG
ncbi:MAG: hypothetical protein IH997_00370 [Proteobacteria bacterium]|nr:hypothetical protein [Pseudomonadota bacterium]